LNKEEVEEAEKEQEGSVVLEKEDLKTEQALHKETELNAEKVENNSAVGHKNSS